jgi:hypothetical protein
VVGLAVASRASARNQPLNHEGALVGGTLCDRNIEATRADPHVFGLLSRKLPLIAQLASQPTADFAPRDVRSKVALVLAQALGRELEPVDSTFHVAMYAGVDNTVTRKARAPARRKMYCSPGWMSFARIRTKLGAAADASAMKHLVEAHSDDASPGS